MKTLPRKGFTLLEILVVLTIIALTLSIIFPKMFLVLKANDKREQIVKLIEKINEYRWKAFEKKKMVLVFEDNGVVSAETEGKTKTLWKPGRNVLLAMSDALVCMPNGAVNGVTVKIDFKTVSYYIVFTPFDGEVEITKKNE